MAKYKFDMACCKMVERIWENAILIGAEPRRREFLAAAHFLIQQRAEELYGSALCASRATHTIEEEFHYCEVKPRWRKHEVGPAFPIRPQNS